MFLLCQRVRLRSFLCFFLRIFFRLFFTTELTLDHLLARFAGINLTYYTISRSVHPKKRLPRIHRSCIPATLPAGESGPWLCFPLSMVAKDEPPFNAGSGRVHFTVGCADGFHFVSVKGGPAVLCADWCRPRPCFMAFPSAFRARLSTCPLFGGVDPASGCAFAPALRVRSKMNLWVPYRQRRGCLGWRRDKLSRGMFEV